MSDETTLAAEQPPQAEPPEAEPPLGRRGRPFDRRAPYVMGLLGGFGLLTAYAFSRIFISLGGTLVQHLPDVVGHHGHAESEGVFGRHKVRPVPGTRLADALPEPAEVPTYHHQAVDRLGGGLVAVAHTDDGTVEAVELPGEAFVLAVQWHPEMGDDPRLLEALVAAAR